MVDDVGLTVFLGAQNFLLQCFFHSSLRANGRRFLLLLGLGRVLSGKLGRQDSLMVVLVLELILGPSLSKTVMAVDLITVGVITTDILVVTLDLFDGGDVSKAIIDIEDEGH